MVEVRDSLTGPTEHRPCVGLRGGILIEWGVAPASLKPVTSVRMLRKLGSPVGLSGTFVEGGITEPYLGGTRS